VEKGSRGVEGGLFIKNGACGVELLENTVFTF
jgi:hypothetical protein